MLDGGGALLLQPSDCGRGTEHHALFFFQMSLRPEDALHRLIHELGGPAAVGKKYGAIFAGIPAARRDAASEQLKLFLEMTRCTCPVIDYQKSDRRVRLGIGCGSGHSR